uniref:Uncharacterized protein n=1 Tax=Arundo donax TaxID=35708 RepID=A0A0A9GTB1_ARUDO
MTTSIIRETRLGTTMWI